MRENDTGDEFTDEDDYHEDGVDIFSFAISAANSYLERVKFLNGMHPRKVVVDTFSNIAFSSKNPTLGNALQEHVSERCRQDQ
jgi:hypothetical protein